MSNLVDETSFKYKQNSQLFKSIWNRIRSLRYISIALFLMRSTTENYEIPTRKNLGPTKYPRENILDPRNTHEKNFGPMKYVRRLDVTVVQDTQDSDVT